ncbi:hypothetical protein BVRB_9g211850 [Beta vulgaris subsp. vulgaris]|nr:hypothetical protein BVRB_9g211850 [Beta vulgaris subsp. vulgaris]
MSGDRQTLKEFTHQILARRTVRNPPPNVVPGLDIQPLREHVWLDSLTDTGVMANNDFYNRLARDVGPSHLPVVDLDLDNDSIASMDETALLAELLSCALLSAVFNSPETRAAPRIPVRLSRASVVCSCSLLPCLSPSLLFVRGYCCGGGVSAAVACFYLVIAQPALPKLRNPLALVALFFSALVSRVSYMFQVEAVSYSFAS